MKLRSKIDVITNSSTEVFTLRTNKTLSEVSEWLHQNTSGFCEPEIMTSPKDSQVLSELMDFGYLVDPDDPDSIAGFLLESICKTHYYDEHYNNIEIEHAVPLYKAWLEHLWNNKEELARFFRKKYGPDHWKIRFGICWEEMPDRDRFIERALQGNLDYGMQDSESYPPGFVEAFLDSWTGPRPKSLELPDYKNVKYWIGKIGFSGITENSIPYEDFDKINDTFDGSNWHMG